MLVPEVEAQPVEAGDVTDADAEVADGELQTRLLGVERGDGQDEGQQGAAEWTNVGRVEPAEVGVAESAEVGRAEPAEVGVAEPAEVGRAEPTGGLRVHRGLSRKR